MVADLRTHLAAILAPVYQATLATYGPAGLLAHVVPCVADGVQLFLLLPPTSDHLVNLEASPTVVMATTEWCLRGRAHLIAAAQHLLVPHFPAHPDTRWNTILEVTPTRLDVAHRRGWGGIETFDFDDCHVPFHHQ